MSVLEFAELAEAAGGMNFLTCRALENNSIAIVPPGVLTILPGSGSMTGNEIAQNSLVRKLDITVSRLSLWILLLGCTRNSYSIERQAPKLDGL